MRAKYKAEPLRSALREVFGERTIGQASRRLLIPAVDLTKGSPVVFKTHHLPGLFRDASTKAVDVAMATAAAPTYFPPSAIGSGSCYADGGLWANNPSLIAYAEACRIHQRCRRAEIDPVFEMDEVSILSVGTGLLPYFKKAAADTGILFWGKDLLEISGAAQSQGANTAAQYLLSQKYRRIDFTIPDRSWALDSTELTPQLIHCGKEICVANLNSLRVEFFTTLAPSFTSF